MTRASAPSLTTGRSRRGCLAFWLLIAVVPPTIDRMTRLSPLRVLRRQSEKIVRRMRGRNWTWASDTLIADLGMRLNRRAGPGGGVRRLSEADAAGTQPLGVQHQAGASCTTGCATHTKTVNFC